MHAEFVGFFFGAARELEVTEALDQSACVVQDVPDDSAAEQDSCQETEIQGTHFSFVLHGMPRGNVRNFVRHHTCQLGFIVSRQD